MYTVGRSIQIFPLNKSTTYNVKVQLLLLLKVTKVVNIVNTGASMLEEHFTFVLYIQSASLVQWFPT